MSVPSLLNQYPYPYPYPYPNSAVPMRPDSPPAYTQTSRMYGPGFVDTETRSVSKAKVNTPKVKVKYGSCFGTRPVSPGFVQNYSPEVQSFVFSTSSKGQNRSRSNSQIYYGPPPVSAVRPAVVEQTTVTQPMVSTSIVGPPVSAVAVPPIPVPPPVITAPAVVAYPPPPIPAPPIGSATTYTTVTGGGPPPPMYPPPPPSSTTTYTTAMTGPSATRVATVAPMPPPPPPMASTSYTTVTGSPPPMARPVTPPPFTSPQIIVQPPPPKPAPTSRFEYVPFQRKVTDYETREFIEQVPRPRTVTEYQERRYMERVPREVVTQETMAVETRTPPQRMVQKMEYMPVEKRIVHYPQQQEMVTKTIIEQPPPPPPQMLSETTTVTEQIVPGTVNYGYGGYGGYGGGTTTYTVMGQNGPPIQTGGYSQTIVEKPGGYNYGYNTTAYANPATSTVTYSTNPSYNYGQYSNQGGAAGTTTTTTYEVSNGNSYNYGQIPNSGFTAYGAGYGPSNMNTSTTIYGTSGTPSPPFNNMNATMKNIASNYYGQFGGNSNYTPNNPGSY